MLRRWRRAIWLWPAMLGCAVSPAWGQQQRTPSAEAQRRMPDVITRFSADQESLWRTYRLGTSPERAHRFKEFYEEEQTSLGKLPFAALGHEDQVDYVLLQVHLADELHSLDVKERQDEAMLPLLPYAATVDGFVEQQRKMLTPDAQASALALAAVEGGVKNTEAKLSAEEAQGGKSKVDPVTANRAVQASLEMKRALHNWFEQYDGYDPLFTWWCAEPYKKADAAIDAHIAFLKEKLIGIKSDDKTTIIGDPVGREALQAELADNLIPYTPEELIAIAQTEYDWCMREMLKASHEMGYGDDWHAAVEKAKQMHVPPGEQPELIRSYMFEAIDFVKAHDLVTVPPLAVETLRMIMMTPERQLVNPFFTGGDEISVSYPTDTMTIEQRMMSMRGNSSPLSHATVFHEMIPGHFLQFYMAARYNPYRREFETPFWHEGNSLWWEMLFWDMGFQRTPAERVGALVWRMHRSARVIFTMNFHLGRWTPQQCVQFLVDNVGFERDNATAEVRRSFDGSVGPLYQSAYLMGGLQFRALHHELVDSGKMTNQQFHDAILQENSMPIELLRADLEHLPLHPNYVANWKFYGDHPSHP